MFIDRRSMTRQNKYDELFYEKPYWAHQINPRPGGGLSHLLETLFRYGDGRFHLRLTV